VLSDPIWRELLEGKFIVLDGPDGCGKTTQLKRLVLLAREAGLDPLVVHEPGGTAVGERVRALLLDKDLPAMNPYTEVMLFMASRVQLWHEMVRPARSAGRLVLSDRWVSSMLAYQGSAGGISWSDILGMSAIAFGTENVWPDLTVIFDVEYGDARSRMTRRGESPDRIENKPRKYHIDLRAGYMSQVDVFPQHCVCVNTRFGIDHTYGELLTKLMARLKGE